MANMKCDMVSNTYPVRSPTALIYISLRSLTALVCLCLAMFFPAIYDRNHVPLPTTMECSPAITDRPNTSRRRYLTAPTQECTRMAIDAPFNSPK